MVQGTPTPCLFCGRTAPEVKITSEHVLRRWYRQHIEAVPDGVYDRTSLSSVLDPETGKVVRADQVIPESAWEQRLREVCSDCNEWSNNAIEVPAQSVALALMLGHPLSLSMAGSAHLATWAAKTAMVRDAAEPGMRTVSRDQWAWLRESASPPLGTAVFAGMVRERHPSALTRHRRIGGPHEARTHISMFELAHLVLVVVGSDDLGVSHELTTRLFEVPKMKPLWPAHQRTTLGDPAMTRDEALALLADPLM